MRKIIPLFITVIFGSAFLCFGPKSTLINSQFEKKTVEPEEFAKQLIKIVSEKNYEGLGAITLTHKEGIDLINFSELDPKEKARGLITIEKQVKEMQLQSKQSLDDVIRKLEMDGVILKDIKYTTCEYKIEKTRGIYGLDLYIDATCNEHTFRLRSRGNLKANNNWRFTGHLIIYPTKNEARLEAREKAIMDSIATAISESMQGENGDK